MHPDSSPYQCLQVIAHGAIDELVLNRPAQLNAFTHCMIAELLDYFRSAASSSARVIVMRGAGRAFCAGMDLNEGVEEGSDQSLLMGMMSTQQALSEIVLNMRRCPQPIIALPHGAAAGGGFALCLAADVRMAAPTLKMIPSFIRIGLSAGDMGCSYFLPRIVGRAAAAEIMMSGRTIPAERAVQYGLVSPQLLEPDALFEAGMALANDMLNASPLGLRMTKELLNINSDAANLEAAVALENRCQVLCGQTDDQREGVAAFLEKRAPNYRGR